MDISELDRLGCWSIGYVGYIGGSEVPESSLVHLKHSRTDRIS